MTDALAIGLLVAIPPTLAALGNTYVGWRRERRLSAEREETRAESNAKLDHITVLTNSTLAAAKSEIAALTAEVSKLKDVIRRMIADRANDNLHREQQP